MAGLSAIALSILLAADAKAGGASNAIPPEALAPAPPRQAAETQRIELKDARDGSGELLYETSRFTARIAPDGSVRFTDKRLSGLSAMGWLPMQARTGVPSLQASLGMLLRGRNPPPAQPTELDLGLAPPETKQLIPEVSRYRPDPREACRACPVFNELAVPVQGVGHFDVSDELARFSGKDPNRYQKAVFLAATRDKRTQMAVKMHAQNIRRANVALPPQLEAIACDERLSHKQRRNILVALAQEMDTKAPEGASAAKAIGTFVGRFDAGTVACAKPPP